MASGQSPIPVQTDFSHGATVESYTPMPDNTLFKAAFVNQRIFSLLLVENSQAMSFIWDDLRDRCLTKLMDRLKMAAESTGADLNVWVTETQPLQASSSSQPRQYVDGHRALHEVCLNYMPENRISYSKVHEAIDFLTGLGYQHETPALHLIIVAASSPIDTPESSPSQTMNAASDRSTWDFLAQRLVQANILCHTVTRSSEDMSALNQLFATTVHLGGKVEDVSFAVDDPEVKVRLSMAPALVDNFQSYGGQSNPPPRPTRIMMPPRRNTYPLDACYAEPYHELPLQEPRPSEMDTPPSLVTQLQQVHGLTKKKVYGAKPVRQPFIKEERVQQPEDGYAIGGIQQPAYLPDTTIPPPVALSAGGGRIPAAKVSRMARIQSSPLEQHSRRYHPGWPRGSRLSSPDTTDPLPSPSSVATYSDISPTTSYISSDVSSPVSPASIDDLFGVTPRQPPMGTLTSVVSGGHSDPTWLQTGYPATYGSATSPVMPHGHNYYMPDPSGMPVYSAPPHPSLYTDPSLHVPQGVVVLEPPIPALEVAKSALPPALPPPVSSAPTGVAPSPPAPTLATQSTTGSITGASTPPASTPQQAPVPAKRASRRPEDDEYFELDQAYIEATTKIFNEFFPNAGFLPEAPASGTKSATTPTKVASSSISSGTKSGQSNRSARKTSKKAAIIGASPPTSSTRPTSRKSSLSSSPSSKASTSPASTGLAETSYSSSAPLGGNEPFSASGYATLLPDPSHLSPAVGLVESHPQSPILPHPYHSSIYSSLGTSSLTGWAG